MKIDQAFVSNLTTNPEDAAICLAIIGPAHNLHITVIAEGMENEGQANYLHQHHCDEIQGYYFSRPLPVSDFEQLLAQRRTLALSMQPVGERRTPTVGCPCQNLIGPPTPLAPGTRL